MIKHIFFVFLFLSTTSITSFANDETTPAQETVCDELVGSTPGLYGLCVAYCEAQDNPESILADVPLDEQDLNAPSRKILENYDKKKKETDPNMPCVQYETSCPLFTPAELSEISTDFYDGAEDYHITTSTAEQLRERAYDTSSPRRATIVLTNISDTIIVGKYQKVDENGNVLTNRSMVLTLEEYSSCRRQIINNDANKLD